MSVSQLASFPYQLRVAMSDLNYCLTHTVGTHELPYPATALNRCFISTRGGHSYMRNTYGCDQVHSLWPPKIWLWPRDLTGKTSVTLWLRQNYTVTSWLWQKSMLTLWLFGAIRWTTPISAIYGVTKPGHSRKYCAYTSVYPLFPPI